MEQSIPDQGRFLIAQADDMLLVIRKHLQRMRDSIAPGVADRDLARFSRSPRVRQRIAIHPALDRALIAAEAAAAGRRLLAERCAAAIASGERGGSFTAEAVWWLGQAEQTLSGLRRASTAVRKECERALLGLATAGQAEPVLCHLERRASR